MNLYCRHVIRVAACLIGILWGCFAVHAHKLVSAAETIAAGLKDLYR